MLSRDERTEKKIDNKYRIQIFELMFVLAVISGCTFPVKTDT